VHEGPIVNDAEDGTELRDHRDRRFGPHRSTVENEISQRDPINQFHNNISTIKVLTVIVNGRNTAHIRERLTECRLVDQSLAKNTIESGRFRKSKVLELDCDFPPPYLVEGHHQLASSAAAQRAQHTVEAVNHHPFPQGRTLLASTLS
jgi:hypothetical protein